MNAEAFPAQREQPLATDVPAPEQPTRTLREQAEQRGLLDQYDIVVEQLATDAVSSSIIARARQYHTPEHEIDDVRQDVALRLLQRPEYVNSDTRRISGLPIITKRMLVIKYRRETSSGRRERHLVADFTAPAFTRRDGAETIASLLQPEADPAPQLIDTIALKQTLNELPKLQNEVSRRFYFLDMTHPEIAKELGIPVATSKACLRAALKKLRVMLDPEDFEY